MKGFAVAVELIILILVFLPSCESKLDVSYGFIFSQRLSALSALINHLPFASAAHIHAVYSPQ